MKLNQPPRQKLRVSELARELGWTSRQLLAELANRGEFVKSSASQLEAPVIRALRREFGTASECPDPDATVSPELYGWSAELTVTDVDTGFADDLAKAIARSNAKGQNRAVQRHPPIMQMLLDEVVVPQRPEHLSDPASGYFAWEVRKAAKLNRRWAEAQLSGLGDDNSLVIKWIRLSDGQRPELAVDLADGGISPDEADLHIGHGGRIDMRLPSIYERFRSRRINRSEAIAIVRQWRRRQQAG